MNKYSKLSKSDRDLLISYIRCKAMMTAFAVAIVDKGEEFMDAQIMAKRVVDQLGGLEKAREAAFDGTEMLQELMAINRLDRN